MKESKIIKFSRKEKPSRQKTMPSLKREINFLLSGEEANITPSKILAGATSIAIFNLLFDHVAVAAHHSNHHNSTFTYPWYHANAHGSLGNLHGNQIQHTNLTPTHVNSFPHGNASTQHANQLMGHASTNPHSNSASPAVNTHANDSSTATKGFFHNNASKGAHQASLGHDNILNSHANAATVHTSVAPHTSAAPHNNAVPHVSYIPHDNSTVGHYNVAPHRSINPHASNHGSGATQFQHCNHGSHGQW